MGFRRRLIVFGYPLAEILTFWAVASIVGFGWAVVGILAGIPIGAWMWRRAATYVQPPSQPDKAAAFAAAGLLWMVPGFLTDCAGIAVVIPGVRRWLITLLPLPGQFVTVRGEVLYDEPTPNTLPIIGTVVEPPEKP